MAKGIAADQQKAFFGRRYRNAGESHLPQPHSSQNEAGRINTVGKDYSRADLGQGTDYRYYDPGPGPRQSQRAQMSERFIPYRTVEEVGMKQPGRTGMDSGRAGKNVMGPKAEQAQVKKPVRYQHG